MSGKVKTRLRLRRAIVPIIPVLALALLIPGTAAAESCGSVGNDPTAAQYCSAAATNNHGNDKGVTASHSTKPEVSAAEASGAGPTNVQTESVPSSSSGASLPFTGLDAIVLLAVGLALVAVGIALFRLSRLRTEPR